MKRLMVAAGLGLLAVAPLAAAQDQNAGSGFNVTYAVRAKGITAADYTLNVTFSPGAYEATANRRATGLVRTMVGSKQDYRYAVRGALRGSSVRPAAYEHQGGRRNRLVRATFANDDVTTTANPAMGMGNPPATREQRRGVVDQVSAMVSLVLSEGDPCARTIKVYMDGRSRFDFAMAPNGRQNVNIAGYRGQAYRCRVAFRPIAGFSDPQEPAALTFLLAPLPNGMYAPLRIEMPTDDAGVVTLEARQFSARGQRPS
jgi:hypothetical protein